MITRRAVAGAPSLSVLSPVDAAPDFAAPGAAALSDTALSAMARRVSSALPHAVPSSISDKADITARRRPFPFCSNRMLVARGLTKEYQSGTQRLTVLRDVSFDVPQGAFVSIVGPSGSGKTTLLGLLAGLDTPSHGTVSLDGVEFGSLDEDRRAKLRGEKVGFVFQSFQLIPTLTAVENVQVPLELSGALPAREATARAKDLLARVGLGDRTHHFPQQLSGGEQQRVALARAFVNEPRILFADEPTGNLDGTTGERIVELLQSLNRERGCTIVLVTHDVALAARTQRTIRLRDGVVVEDIAHTPLTTTS
jgi:putative ABC transport system ATP-binding protein